MEYDPAFPTEDNDDEVDHVFDVTAIPLPISTKRKSKRHSKLMKIPLPDDKSELISKPSFSSIIESSNSPSHESDINWLLPTSTQGPLKFNILKPNSIKPSTDEDSSIFDDIESKLIDSAATTKSVPKLLPPKKAKPATLPTGVITKNADFVVSEPKTNTELFLPPKIASTIEGMPTNFIENSSNSNLMTAASNNQNINNQYQLLNMSYIIPQKLRSAQMICQPLVANPAVAALSQKKAVQETTSKTRNSSKSMSKSPKLSKIKSETDGSTKEEQQQKTNVKRTRSISSGSDKCKLSRESRSNSKDFKNSRKKQNKFHSRSRSGSETRNKWSNNTGSSSNSKWKNRRSISRRRSQSITDKQYQESSKNNDRSGSKSRSRINRRSPYQSRHKSSADSRNRRSHSPHRLSMSSNKIRQSPTQSVSERYKDRRRSTSKSTRKTINKSSKRKGSHNKRKSISPESSSARRQIGLNGKRGQQSQHHNRKSRSPANSWLCDDDEIGTDTDTMKEKKPSKDCWAVESEPENEPKLPSPLVSKSYEKKIKPVSEVPEMSSAIDNVKVQPSKIEEINTVDEKSIVSSSNTVFNDLKIDKNEDAIVSSTVDESRIDYMNDENDRESVKHDTDSQKSQPSPTMDIKSSHKSPKIDLKSCHSEKEFYCGEKSIGKLKRSEQKESRIDSKSKKSMNRKSSKCRERSNCRSPAKRSHLQSRSRSGSAAEPKSKKKKEESYGRSLFSRNKNYDNRLDYENDNSFQNSPLEKYSSGKSKKKTLKESHSPISKTVRRADRWEKETKTRNRSTSSHCTKPVEKVKLKKRHHLSDSSVDSCGWHDERKSRKEQSRNWKIVHDRSFESISPSHRDQRKYYQQEQQQNSLKYSGTRRKKDQSESCDSRNDYDVKMKNLEKKTLKRQVHGKRKRHSEHSNSESNSGSKSSTEETTRRDDWKKVIRTNEKRYELKRQQIAKQKRKDSDSSSMNSGKIPASYQGVKKRKEKFSISDSEMSFESIKRKHKSQKTRRI